MRAHKVMAGVVTSLSVAVVPSALPQVEDLSDQELYETACGSCHGPDGTGCSWGFWACCTPTGTRQ